MAVEIETVLVPVDGTSEAERAVEYAVAVAQRYDAGVHVLHVVGESVARGVQHGAIDADDVADDHQAFMDTVRGYANGVPVTQSVALGFSATKLTQHPVGVVLDTADEIGADFVVVPRESVREQPTAMLGKVAQYVLSYASQPVLSV
ncbi:universal stress protein [Halapricum salinum]|uniref:Universal stress protein n=1 Tax=Halapricum salinum TaxID=1457250 RepID=A0A4D6H9K9_9EURY|nr:universal stress protein [Halapricum salinum]QCC50589.1 universal stress protein [Halapricum salinum]